MNTVENISKMCRVCCDCTSNNNLIFLLDAENKAIVKKLRACADITVSTNQEREKSTLYGCCDLVKSCVEISLFQTFRLNQMTCCQSTFVWIVYKILIQHTCLKSNANIWIRIYGNRLQVVFKSIPH